MKILVYGINYAPELTGIGKYTGEMCEWLASQGHEVTMLTAKPYYPEWEVHQVYQHQKGWIKENINGVTVYRVPFYVPKEVSSIKRIIHEFSFVLSGIPFWCKAMFKPKYDVVISVAPPFHLGIVAAWYKKIKKTPLVYHIQDLQVDAAKDLGMLKNKTFLKLMFGMEKYIINQATKVSTISWGMQRKIEHKGVDKEKIMQIPNWVDIEAIKPLPKEESLRKRFNIALEDKVVLYSGNLGEKQGLESIITVAERTKANSNLKYVICGSGGAKDRLVALAKAKQLQNVLFFPLQPYEDLPNLLATADLHLVLQKKSASDLVMPSKLTGIVASGGVPIVTAVKGTTLYQVVSDFDFGVLCEPENDKALYETIVNTIPLDLSEKKENSRLYAERYLGKTHILKQLERDLLSIIN